LLSPYGDNQTPHKENQMLYELYTREKLRELERARRVRLPGRAAETAATRWARALGGLLRRLGVGLEGWGNPGRSEPECCEACG
jgi:hypothetical protein